MAKRAPLEASSDRVLDVAARLFADHGFAAVSVRDLARAAGILPGSLHYRFASKEDVLVALMERAVDRLMRGVVEAIAEGADPVERVRLAIRAHVRGLLSGDPSVYVLLYDWRSLSPAAAQAITRQRARYEQFSDELLEQAAAVAPVRPGVDLKLLRLFGFGAVNWAAQWYEPNGPYTPDQIADAFWQYLAFGALSSEPPHKGAGHAARPGARQPSK